MEQAPRILLVNDDPALCKMLSDYLRGHGFSVVVSGDGEAGLALVGDCDLALVADMLQGLSGLDVLRGIRQHGDVPVVMLSAASDEVDRIVALELGADDSVSRSCNLRELLARLRAILRRSRQAAPAGKMPKEEATTLALFPAERRATWQGQPIKLTSTEFNLLEILFRHSGSAIPKVELGLRVLGREMGQDDRSLDMHISNLRKKLGRLADGRSPIQSVRGAGYQLLDIEHAK